jgi:hypothetical protein
MRSLALGTLALLIPVAGLHGQSAADRAALDALRDSLATVTAPEGLAAFAGKGSGTTGLLRSALVSLRRGELGKDRGPYDEGIMLVERALDAEGEWPCGWFTLGLTQFGMYQRAFVVKQSHYLPSGLSYREAAMRAFMESIKVDSAYIPSADALAGIVLSLGHRLLPKVLRGPLTRAAGAPGATPEVHLALARVTFSQGDYDASLVSLGDYLRKGGDRGLAGLEQARTLMATGRKSEATGAYLGGLTDLTETGRLAFREDLAWIASAPELAAFDSLPVSGLGEWIRRFWRERDALELRTPDERLSEHLRRWVYAHQNFLLHRPDDVPANAEGFGPQDQGSLYEVGAVADVMTEVAGGIPAFRSYRRTQWEIDDRGVLYLRHGEPTKKVSSVAGPPNESWAYDLPEGRRVFHFIASRALGTQAATTLTASLPLDPDMLEARSDLDSRYAALADRIQRLQAQGHTQAQANQRAIAMAALNDAETGDATAQRVASSVAAQQNTRLGADVLWREVARNRTAIAAAVASDGFPQHYKSSLDAIVQVYGLGFDQGQSPRLLTVFAAPGRRLTPVARPDGGPGVLYPITFRIIALDRATGVLRQLDTTRTFLAKDTLTGDAHLTGLLEMPVPPGSYQVRILVSQKGQEAGTGVGRDSVTLGSPRELRLSDLVLGRSESGLAWTYAGTKVALNPLNAFPKGADADLFYEIGGLTPGQGYEVTVAVRKPDDRPDAKPALQVGFNLSAGATYERVSRRLGLGNLKAGSYLLEVRVKESAPARSVTRRQILNILEKP